VLASITRTGCGDIVVSSRKPEVMAMTTRQHTHRQPVIWRFVRAVASALHALQREQGLMWELWWQANRATVSTGNGPLRWVLTLDGYRLAGSYLPVQPGIAT
jgi:hypothetical protein